MILQFRKDIYWLLSCTTTESRNNFLGDPILNTKYLYLKDGIEYHLRFVSGFVPYRSVWDEGTFKISPQTLAQRLLNGNIIFKKENGSPYADDECWCPFAQEGRKLQQRYVINVIQTKEYLRLGSSCPIYVLDANHSMFKQILEPVHGVAAWHLTEGFDFTVIKTAHAGSKFLKNFIVEPTKNIPLSPAMIDRCTSIRSPSIHWGVWPLLDIVHPFKCSKRRAVDNGHNPLFEPIVYPGQRK